MDCKEYQKWLSEFFKERDWYALSSFIRVNFLSEETGEVARAIRAIEIGRDRPDEPTLDKVAHLQNLEEELGDVLANVFILADKYGLEVEDILKNHKKKLVDRFHS